jgi:IS605 OrfB family transposase
MLLAHKIELRPTVAQQEYLDKACGTKRHCYNQLLEYFSKKENPFSLKAAYDFYKNVIREQFEWYAEISFHISANAIQDLHNAFNHFFRRVKLEQKPGFPNYKAKDYGDSFSMRTPQKFGVFGMRLRIEKLKTYITHLTQTNYVTKNFDRIVIEDLNVKGMIKNRKLSRAISDVGFGMLRQFIEYKAKLRKCVVVVADRFFPSSKTCSDCGTKKQDLTLADRIFNCDCGLVIDRDLNAAIMLNNYGRDENQRDPKCT